ncbi:MAG: hypothetical protein ACFCVA_03485 [Gammaproteobacteria bacterium]
MALATCLTPTVKALSLGDTAQVHGFFSQSIIGTSNNNFFGSTQDRLSCDFRELGLNGSWRPWPNLQLSMQGTARWAGQTDTGNPRLDYGFLDYSIVSDPITLAGLRIGRIINPFGLYNDTRDVAFTRPSIILPQSIYFDRTRDLAFSGDGVQVYVSRTITNSELSLQLNSIFPRVTESVERALLGDSRPGTLKSKLSFVGRLLYQRDGGKVKLGLSGVGSSVGYDPSADQQDLPAGSIDFNAIYLSAEYNALKWTITGEYALRNFQYEKFQPVIPNTDTTGDSAYVQLAYRFARQLEGMVRYDVLYTDRDDRRGANFSAMTGKPAFSRFAKDLTVGLRWDLNRYIMLRGEVHFIDGTGWLPTDDNPDISKTSKDWNLIAIQAALRF